MPRTREQRTVTTIRPTIATTILASALLPQLTGQVDTTRWTGRHPAPNRGEKRNTPAVPRAAWIGYAEAPQGDVNDDGGS